jgi:YegS/Rv2252/BmrU family lipid kinase
MNKAAGGGRRRVGVVQNADAGNAGDRGNAVVASLAQHFDVSTYQTGPERDPAACAREAVAEGAEVVVAAGGDGTVSAVASALVGSQVALGVVPLGTSNSFAAALGIPDDADAACALIATGKRRILDTARAGDRVVILHAMIGFHADAIAETSTDAKQRWGVLAYAAQAVRQLADLTSFRVELDLGTRAVRCDAVAVAVANVAPAKTILAQGPPVIAGDDGLLDVTIVAADGVGDLVAAAAELMRSARAGEAADDPRVGYLRAASVRIDCDPSQRVLVDGEDAGTTPISLRAVPRSLWVVADSE